MTRKQRVATGESLNQNLDELAHAIAKVWKRIQSKSLTIKAKKMPLDGDVRTLFSAEDITAPEKTMPRAHLGATSNIAGCRAMQQKIGHCCFGFRVALGEVIFVAASPNRRRSQMILKLARARRNGASLGADDEVPRWRRQGSTKTMREHFAHKEPHY